ncbi:hypothetical protein CRG98_010534 [Punica granatum]|uniref:Uncharacterized protein n=1 Tax=Punica granatum TaxID=22663 RepID=A0A2I0KKM0_PUNGR|nr:hypothetical protein CRG98_010534 [Punica granatum]
MVMYALNLPGKFSNVQGPAESAQGHNLKNGEDPLREPAIDHVSPQQFSSSHKDDSELFANLLVETMAGMIRTLYEYGARKVMLTGVGMIECTSHVLARLLVIDQRCCSIGKNHGFLTCVPHLTPCKNRDWYVIQDAYHRTEAAYLLLVKKFGNKARSYTYPYDYPPASRAINETPVSKISRSFNKEFTNYV